MTENKYKEVWKGVLIEPYNPLALPAPEFGLLTYMDPVVPFLRLMVSSKARKWRFRKNWNNEPIDRSIGDASLISVAEARLRALDMAKGLEDDLIPPTKKQRVAKVLKQRITLGEVWEQYFENHILKNARSAKEIGRSYNQCWTSIKNIRACELTGHDIMRWMNHLAEKSGRTTANKQWALLRASLRWGQSMNIVKLENDPLEGIKAFKSESKPMSYVKSAEELERLAEALAYEEEDTRDAIWLLVWTGQRRENILSMEWSWVDFANKLLTIPAAKAKSKRTCTVALTERALEVLIRRRSKPIVPGSAGDQYVFATRRASKVPYLSNISKAWLRIRKRAGLETLRIHDLRHSMASWLAMTGASAFVIKQALQHGSITTSQRYTHLDVGDVRESLEVAQSIVANGGKLRIEPKRNVVVIESFTRKDGKVIRGYEMRR